MFEPNQGQGSLDPSDARVKYIARGSGYSLYLGSEGAILNLQSSRRNHADKTPAIRMESLQMKLAGANPKASVTAIDQLPGKSNYFLGNDASKWRKGVPQFARVRYENVYPGINLLFYGNQGRLEYDFQVAPGSDPKQAELEFNGARKVELHAGALTIKGEGGDIRLEAPQVYQEVAGRRVPVEGSFVLRGANRAGFAIGPYDHSRELVIDPQLTYTTYFGGSGDENHVSVAVDGSFNIYLTGSTTSTNLPAVGVFQTTLKGAQNVFIAKIVPTLGSNPSTLTYVTYLGGEGTDYPVGIAVDGAGNPYVAGTTTSSLFPVTQTTAYQSSPEPSTASTCPVVASGICHVFVTELNNDANGLATQLLYSSYLSGNGNDIASGMTIDASGDIFVTGTTTSQQTSPSADQFPASNLPQKLPYQSTSRAPLGQPQFFVTKVNTNGSRAGSILYSTYFGGGTFQTTNPIATGGGIVVDTNGNMYFTGTTNYTYQGCQGCQTTDFPILNAYQPCLDQAAPVVIVNPPVCSNTTSTSNPDAFVAKINPNAAQGQQLLWSTYFGGSNAETGTGIALDAGAAHVYITGTTDSPGITTALTFAAYQTCLDQPVNPTAGTACTNTSGTSFPTDAYVAQFSNPTTATTGITNVGLTYFSYLGGSSNDTGLAMAVDAAGGALVTGSTTSTDFPVNPAQNDIQSALNGPQNAFMARLNTSAVIGQTTTASWSNPYGGNGMDEGTSIALDVNQNSYFAGDTTSTAKLSATGLQTSNAGGSDAFLAQVGSSSTLFIKGVLSLGTSQIYVSAGNQTTFTYTITNGGPDPAYGLVVQDNIDQSITQIPLSFVSATATSGTCSNSVSTSNSIACTIPTLQSGSTATVTIVLTPTANSSGTQQSFNGGSVQVLGTNNIVLAHTTVSATMSDFTMTVNPSSNSVAAAGETATYQVQLTPHPVYATNVALSCAGTPPGSSCNFTTSPVTLQGPATSTLNITTTARPIVTPTASLLSRHFYAVWLGVPGLAFFTLGASGRRRRRVAGLMMLCALFMLLVFQPACSKNNTITPVSGTPAGQYNIVVTATSGTDSKSATISLNVP